MNSKCLHCRSQSEALRTLKAELDKFANTFAISRDGVQEMLDNAQENLEESFATIRDQNEKICKEASTISFAVQAIRTAMGGNCNICKSRVAVLETLKSLSDGTLGHSLASCYYAEDDEVTLEALEIFVVQSGEIVEEVYGFIVAVQAVYNQKWDEKEQADSNDDIVYRPRSILDRLKGAIKGSKSLAKSTEEGTSSKRDRVISNLGRVDKADFDSLKIPLPDNSENEKHLAATVAPAVFLSCSNKMHTPDTDDPLQRRCRCRCVMCAELFSENDGISCGNGHFVCWNECFDPYVQSASQPGAIGRSVSKHGHLKCPGVGCDEEYNLMKVASVVENSDGPQHIFDALLGLRDAAKISYAVQAQLADHEHRLQENFLRIQAIQDADLRRAETVRLTIVEELYVRCPRCRLIILHY